MCCPNIQLSGFSGWRLRVVSRGDDSGFLKNHVIGEILSLCFAVAASAMVAKILYQSTHSHGCVLGAACNPLYQNNKRPLCLTKTKTHQDLIRFITDGSSPAARAVANSN